MKFGGTSVAGTERLKARRAAAGRPPTRRETASSPSSRRWATTTDELDRARAPDVARADRRASWTCCISVGERISCALAAMAINDLGHEAISLTGSQAGIVTDPTHGKAKIADVRARRDPRGARLGKDRPRRRLPGRLRRPRRDDARPRRLGPDRRRARRRPRRRALEIYTDVEGVFTADPRIVPSARKLHAVSYEEMLELAASGAKVLQLRSRRVRAQPRCHAARALDVLGRRGHLDRRGGRDGCSRRR